MIDSLILRFLEMPRAADGEDVIGLSDFDVLLTQPRQFQVDHISVLGLVNFRGRRPGGRLRQPPRDAAVDQTHIELVDFALHQAHRIDSLRQWETGFFDVDLRSGKPGKLLIYVFDVRQNLVIRIHSHKYLRSIPTGPRKCKARRLVRRKSSQVWSHVCPELTYSQKLAQKHAHD